MPEIITSEVKENVVTGLWKFTPEVSTETLVELAKKWLTGDDRYGYMHLYVRQCSKHGHHCIGFQYIYEPNPKNHMPYFYKITDQLKRQFGNDFMGWDLASNSWVISIKSHS